MSITTVMAAGDLCLPSIGDCCAELQAALAAGGPVRLDLSAVRAPDLSVVQLVSAARKTAAATHCDFALAAPVDAALRDLLDRAGFLTGASADDLHFWFHGELEQ